MKSFRPRIQHLKLTLQRQYAKAAGIAVLLTLVVAATSFVNFNSKASNLTSPNWDFSQNTWKTSGDWRNCNGEVDNDSAHHTTNLKDTDPAHHMGMVCQGKKEAWSINTPTPYGADVSNTFTGNAKSIKIDQNAFSQLSAVQPETEAQKDTEPAKVEKKTSPSGNPFSGAKLYMNYNNDPAKFVRDNSDNYRTNLMRKIANQPEVTWLGGWNWNITGDVNNAMQASAEEGALPVFTVYNVPGRDCGGYSAGGVSDASSYRNWIGKIADTIGNRKAVVIIEPDGLTLMDCLNDWQKDQRFQMIRDAVNTFKSKGQTAVYIDAGHPNWISASDMSGRLKKAGVDQADGFALNISNFYTNDQNAQYGKEISERIGGKHFIVDTGRNGSGPASDNQWCNPSGRSLGTPPTTNTGNSLIDAYLWVKGPAGSDGNCNGGPSAGTFWPDYAIGLAQRTNW